jgi:hypothetical protein
MCACVIANTRAAAAARRRVEFFHITDGAAPKKYELKMICWLARTCQDCCLEFRKNAIKRGKHLGNVSELCICAWEEFQLMQIHHHAHLSTNKYIHQEQLLPIFEIIHRS